MKLKQKIEIQFFLKGILKNIKRSNTTPGFNISDPVFIFDKLEKETLLMEIITDLELEIHREENEK